MPSTIERVVQRQRYVKVPETAHVKQLRDFWFSQAVDLDPLTQVLGALMAAHRLTVGRFKGLHWYATIVSDVERPEGWPNAISGWGDTPLKALQELAFRWHVGMRGSWNPEAWNLQMVPRFEMVDTRTGEVL